MKKVGLAPYILLSFLIHAGVLIGAHRFLKLPAEELESAKLIPVEMVVVREESPSSEPAFAPGDRVRPIKALQSKSRIMMETATDRSADDMAAPIINAIGFEPNLTIANPTTTGFSTDTQAGESADSKSMILASQNFPLQVSPAYPLAPQASSRLEVKIPEFLVESQAKLTPADSLKPEKVATPLSGSQTAVEPVLEKPPLSTQRQDALRLTLDTNPTLRDVPMATAGETIAGKPVIPASQISPMQLFPADPSPSAAPLTLDARMSSVPVEVKAAVIAASSPSPQKVETPLTGKLLPREDVAVDLQPVPRQGVSEPELMASTLQVQSHPNGAQVYINGMLSGETPMDMELPLGKHEVRLALPDYYDWKAQIELTERNRSQPVFFRLLPIE